METQSQNLSTTADHSQYTKTVCEPRCEIFKDYTKDDELIFTVTSLDEIDQKVREGIVKYLDPREDICQIAVSLRQPISELSVPGVIGNAGQLLNYDWVLVLTRENLVLFDSTDAHNHPMVWKAPIENILSILWGRILMQSWVEWSWLNGGKVEHARINFHTNDEKPIKEMLGYFHEAVISDFGDSHQWSFEQRQIIDALPVKFFDQLSIVLSPQEKILATVNYPFQPAVWKSWHGLFRKQERKATPSMALILTERQDVMVYENADETGSGFGTFIHTVRRKNILNLLTENAPDGSQLILLVGDKNAEEKIIIPAPEEHFEEMIEKFRV